jgi:hypothetical protein
MIGNLGAMGFPCAVERFGAAGTSFGCRKEITAY